MYIVSAIDIVEGESDQIVEAYKKLDDAKAYCEADWRRYGNEEEVSWEQGESGDWYMTLEEGYNEGATPYKLTYLDSPR